MHKRSSLLGLNQSLKFSELNKESASMWVPVRYKSSGGSRPKKKIYYRVHELESAMDLHKKPSLILRLKSII
ncbi:hypothetical protein PanWU01x14_027930 [Parasponia andersonii]|uniref:Uncharacterized protein n=1 Tax=Parasponia andersonii TaxID=3476 RepID=A0A2P5DV50_PARAD|nr:hypothetical protein PanWU01x14_027930 [Parasponia andersonii]